MCRPAGLAPQKAGQEGAHVAGRPVGLAATSSSTTVPGWRRGVQRRRTSAPAAALGRPRCRLSTAGSAIPLPGGIACRARVTTSQTSTAAQPAGHPFKSRVRAYQPLGYRRPLESGPCRGGRPRAHLQHCCVPRGACAAVTRPGEQLACQSRALPHFLLGMRPPSGPWLRSSALLIKHTRTLERPGRTAWGKKLGEEYRPP